MREPELAKVAAFLEQSGEHVAGPLVSELIAGGRSNLTYRLSDGDRSWVLRRPPIGGLTPTAHDVGREFLVCRALGPTPVPVARAVAHEPTGALIGAPFAVLAYVDGLVVRSQDDLHDWSAADVGACADGLVDALVALHAVDVDTVGLGSFARREDHAARQLRRWAGQWVQMGSAHPLEARLRAVLETRLPVQHRTALVHGDYRVDNVLLDRGAPQRVLAIVDWEISTLGDPASDIALMAAYRHPALDDVLGVRAAWTDPRFPDPEELRAAYEAASGVVIDDWDLHLALAFYKLAAIAEGIAYRHHRGATVGAGYERIAEAVPAFLRAGLDRVGVDV
jgi:aminoglycoside phosphotransferase (APT) family kinase protein